MKVIFFQVDNVLNFEGSDALAPSGRMGISEARVKEFRGIVNESGSRIVLIGDWRKGWNFDDSKCTADGKYLIRKLDRKGLHILDKIRDDLSDEEGCNDWIKRHPNVTESCILTDINNVKWVEW